MTEWYEQPCATPKAEAEQNARARQAVLTKPSGALGRLESLAIQLAAWQGVATPSLAQVEIAIFAADHGVAVHGVSAYPSAVTAQMVHNFQRGGAAINVLATQLGAGLTVINAGTIDRAGFPAPVIDQPIGYGTADFVTQSAMTPAECHAALALGRQIIDGYAQPHLVIGGEMGIANTTAASALAVAGGIAPAAVLTGPGSGLAATAVAHKATLIDQAVQRLGAPPSAMTALTALTELGGFEIAALVGFYIRAAQQGIGILVDGFIATVAAWLAWRMNPAVREWMLFAHTSAEPGHEHVLRALAAAPILALDMRLGEGSGAAVAVPLLRAACALHNAMATFTEAGLSVDNAVDNA